MRLALLLLALPSAVAGQVTVFAGVQGGRAEHRTMTTGQLVSASGVVLGGGIGVVMRNRFELRADALGGHLATAGSPNLDDHDVADLQLLAGMKLRPWLSVQAGPVVRTFSNSIARQRWSMARLGATVTSPLALESLHGLFRVYWMPLVSVSGLPRPDIAFSAAAGVEWRGRRVSAGAMYHLERVDFPQTGGDRRLEELSRLELQVTFVTQVKGLIPPRD